MWLNLTNKLHSLYQQTSKLITINFPTYYYLPKHYHNNNRIRECICVSGAYCLRGDCYQESIDQRKSD